MTTHGCGYHPADRVVVDVSGSDIPGVVSKLSPYKVHVNMNGCREAVEPTQISAEAR